MAAKKIIVVGGTGIIGSQLASILEKNDCLLWIISNDSSVFSSSINHIYCDINDCDSFKKTLEKLSNDEGKFDCLIDLIQFQARHAKIVAEFSQENVGHTIILSTTLVYDRFLSSSTPIDESHKLAAMGSQGGYVDGKLQVESVWKKHRSKNHTILRTYHVLGYGSALGCCPLHNRDSKLIDEILKSRTLRLFKGGLFFINIIHPFDLSMFIYKLINNTKSFDQIYNAVNPLPIRVLDYYERIATLLNTKLKVKALELDEYKASKYGWLMTAMEHVYNSDKLITATGYTPAFDLQACIMDAINGYKHTNADQVRDRMNKGMKDFWAILDI